MTQTNTNQQAIAAMKNVMEVTLAKIKNAHTLMWIFIRVKWSFISNVKMDLNGKKHGHTKGVIILINTDKYEGHAKGNWNWGKQGSTDNGDGTVSIRPFAQLESKSGVTLLAIHHGDAKPPDFNLIADAPLLLAEVKRLKAKLFEAELWVNNDSYTFENDIKELIDYLKVIE